MNRIIRDHAQIDKVPLNELAGNGDVFFHRKLILKGEVETVRKVGFRMRFGFFNLVPKKLTCGILTGDMGRKEDTFIHNTAFARIVAVLTVVVAV